MNKPLIYIKLLHTVIWAFLVFIIFYILYAGIINKIDRYVFIAIGTVLLEGVILYLSKGICPLTTVAKKYTNDFNRDNFDIFLPNWVAKNNKIIFTSIFIIGTLIVAFRLFI